MLDLLTAFNVFATGGVRRDPVAILRVTDHNGNVLEEFRPNSGVRVLSEQVAYLMSDILSDFNARLLTFGGGNQLGLNIRNHTVAVKTGTTNDNRDNWAFGFTPAHEGAPFAVSMAAWIGNNDNSPMNPNFFAGAARIWNAAMLDYLSDKPNVGFVRPDGIIDTCVDNLSGKAVGPHTGGNQRCDKFISGTVPTEKDDWRQNLDICTVDGKLASDACKAAGKSTKKFYIKIQAERPEWQDDVNAWVAKTFSGQSQYFPPTQVSTACFDDSGNVVSCSGGSTGPLLSESGVSFYDWSGNSISKNALPAKFEVRATPVAQPGTTIAFVRFSLSGPDCPTWPNECNRDEDGIKEWKVTTSTCGSSCYSSKDNGPSGTALPLFQMDIKDEVVPEDHTLKIEVQDTAGGLKVLEISVKIASP